MKNEVKYFAQIFFDNFGLRNIGHTTPLML